MKMLFVLGERDTDARPQISSSRRRLFPRAADYHNHADHSHVYAAQPIICCLFRCSQGAPSAVQTALQTTTSP